MLCCFGGETTWNRGVGLRTSESEEAKVILTRERERERGWGLLLVGTVTCTHEA